MLVVKNKCDSHIRGSYYYIYNCMQFIDYAFRSNQKWRNAISVDCINYIKQNFRYYCNIFEILLSSEAICIVMYALVVHINISSNY